MDKAFDVRPSRASAARRASPIEDVVVEITEESLRAWLDENPDERKKEQRGALLAKAAALLARARRSPRRHGAALAPMSDNAARLLDYIERGRAPIRMALAGPSASARAGLPGDDVGRVGRLPADVVAAVADGEDGELVRQVDPRRRKAGFSQNSSRCRAGGAGRPLERRGARSTSCLPPSVIVTRFALPLERDAAGRWRGTAQAISGPVSTGSSVSGAAAQGGVLLGEPAGSPR